MNVAIYARVSTQQQAEHGYSLETQVEACRKKAKELDAIESKRQAIMNWFSANLISAEESTQKLQALKKQEQNLTEKLVTKKEDIPTEKIVEDVRHRITPEEKRQFVLDHISKVIVLRKDFVSRYDVDLDVTIIFGS